jgi:hypothetical protein
MSKIEVDQVDPQSGTTLTLGTSGDTVTIPSGVTLANNGTATGFASIDWQSTIVTGATHTAAAGQGLWLDTSSNAITLTLPASPSVGDQVIFTDYARNWGTNAVTLNLNSEKFQGNATPVPVYDTTGESVNIVYSGSTQGWIPNSDGAVALETPQTKTTNFLVIAGGGGGGSSVGGGGGAGGYRNSFNSETSGGGGSAETALELTPGQVYTVTVGDGGAGGPNGGNNGTDGNASSISGSGITTITSVGGGGGGMSNGGNGYSGNVGGSGGGGGGNNTSPAGSGGAGTSNQGYSGGDGGVNSPQQGAGGGGGAGAVGNNGAAGDGGDGGVGVTSTITGSSVVRAGGGGGSGKDSLPGGTGGTGGGGNGNTGSSGSAGAGTVNTGSGGGGAHDVSGGAGGKGVVILRIATADYSGTTSGSPTVSTNGSDTIMVFNSSGSYTA